MFEEPLEINGVLYHVYDNHATAQLKSGCGLDEVIVLPEVNGVPVMVFYFSPCGEKTIKLPASVESVYCSDSYYHSHEIEIGKKDPYLFSDGKALYTKSRGNRELQFFFARDDEEYDIIDGCLAIANRAFERKEKLKRITFPEGLKTIGTEAFWECTGLTEIELPNGLAEIGTRAFYHCYNLKKITLPPTLETIRHSVFEGNSNALSVRLPKSLKKIGQGAFSCNWTLEPDEESENYISRGGFILSKDGHTLVLPAQPPQDGIVVVPEYITAIGENAFFGNKNIRRVILHAGVHTIEDFAFTYTDNLTEINLENVKKLGMTAFMYSGIEKIRLNYDEIDWGVFRFCHRLTDVEIDCEKTGKGMFTDCKALKNVTLKHTKKLDINTFNSAEELKEIVFPPELEELAYGVFAFTSMKSLTIPKTVRKLGHFFANGIKEVHIYDNIETKIDRTNDVSMLNYTLYVHSADTDEIKYVVPIIGSMEKPGIDPSYNRTDHAMLADLFKDGADFDFKQYDQLFFIIREPNRSDKFRAGMTRLKDGYKLDDETRRKYESYLKQLGYVIADDSINKGNIDDILDAELYTYVSLDDMLILVDKAAKQHLTELTAFLMQICNEKRAEKPDKN